jgi:hypothetical protein
MLNITQEISLLLIGNIKGKNLSLKLGKSLLIFKHNDFYGFKVLTLTIKSNV